MSVVDTLAVTGQTRVHIGWDGVSTSATSTTLELRAGASQGSTNLLEVKNSGGTVVSGINQSGNLFIGAGFTAGMGTSGFSVGTGNGYYFSSTTNAFGTSDAGMARASASVVKITGNVSTYGTLAVAVATSGSTDVCTAQSFWFDASYIYYCVASGSIKRAALATF